MAIAAGGVEVGDAPFGDPCRRAGAHPAAKFCIIDNAVNNAGALASIGASPCHSLQVLRCGRAASTACTTHFNPEVRTMAIRNHVLLETNYRRLRDHPPRVAVLPWGATEAHNYHLPYGTDAIQATSFAQRAAELAAADGARVIVLPVIPFGNDQQQLDQVCTISITTPTATALLRDIARSLVAQGIDRLVIVNAHGGNQFQPLVRDLQSELPILIVVANFYQMVPDVRAAVFDAPGDHADETETSLMLHLRPDLVELHRAGAGERIAPAIDGLRQPGFWTPRPWSACHPDTGSGDPSLATAQKGQSYFDAIVRSLATALVDLSAANKGDLPYLR
ncbi:creatininase family protein [Pirellulimonas nuda]|uniref:creatininase family protein n=1 Tax=Pirellulimonas nuda TaxID=2528009 RepID=UPI0018D388D3|nr:creatininase family protein [Pirellulimonas nuda]